MLDLHPNPETGYFDDSRLNALRVLPFHPSSGRTAQDLASMMARIDAEHLTTLLTPRQMPNNRFDEAGRIYARLYPGPDEDLVTEDMKQHGIDSPLLHKFYAELKRAGLHAEQKLLQEDVEAFIQAGFEPDLICVSSPDEYPFTSTWSAHFDRANEYSHIALVSYNEHTKGTAYYQPQAVQFTPRNKEDDTYFKETAERPTEVVTVPPLWINMHSNNSLHGWPVLNQPHQFPRLVLIGEREGELTESRALTVVEVEA